jgi:iron complex transport system permease protein
MEERKANTTAVKIMVMAAIAVITVFISFFLGRYSLTPSKIFALLGERFFDLPAELENNAYIVFYKIRGPRVFAAFLVGAGLSLSGCAYQGVFRNPMVSPDILGATAGAGMGAAIGLLFSLDLAGVQAISFVFGIIAVALTYSVASAVGRRGNMILTLVLAGMVVSALFQAGISLIKYVADPYSKLPAITFWLMGSMSSIKANDLPLIMIPLMIGAVPLFLMRWKINLLSFSDEEAESMGVNPSRIRKVIIVCATLITASVVSVSGIIGWVGLIIPHLARMIVGPDHKILLPCSMIIGGTYLLLVDDVARSLMAMEIPLGILTAIIGAPFFIYLMYRGRSEWL